MMRHFLHVRMHGVIQYLDHYKIGKRYIIVMEYLGDQWVDLYDYIEMFGPLEESHAKAIFVSIMRIVQQMHSLGYSHNDIKGN